MQKFNIKNHCSKEDLLKINETGIYKMYFIQEPEKFYIGKTLVSFRKRLCAHFHKLKHQMAPNKRLLHYFNKYGIESIRIEIIEFNKDYDECWWLELQQIRNNNPFFNIQNINWKEVNEQQLDRTI